MSNAENYDALGGVAIVGMAGRFPGAKNVEQFWQNLEAGAETISFFADHQLERVRMEDAELHRDPHYVKARGVIDNADSFDANFFGINPREATLMDPQQRLFLEIAWEALENAGYDPQTFPGLIGVFAGMANNSYLSSVILTSPLGQEAASLQTMMGNEKDYLATRVSYKLNLRGPSLNIQTACSSSLVAVCQAVQSLLTFQCDMALAGAASVTCPQQRGYLHYEGAIVSPDGHCRAFDAAAQGTVFSNGAGIVVLKRLPDALADGDQLFAVIKGTALNNDGADRVSFAAPNVNGQADAIAMAQALAGVDPDTISYVEAHGTGTSLGDPIEIAALTQAFRLGTTRKGFCAVGSVKTNIGHLDVAAGIAGLIKTACALKHKKIPASLHYLKPNSNINFVDSPFFVNAALRDWSSGSSLRRAGVSSFGSGGTNAHIILEEAPAAEPAQPARPKQLIVFSAKSAGALEQAANNLAQHLNQNSDLNLADVAYTLQTGRHGFDHRRAFVCDSAAGAVLALGDSQRKDVFTNHQFTEHSNVAFMFPGQGGQYVGMGQDLYDERGVFYREVSECAEVLVPYLGFDICQVIYPQPSQFETAKRRIDQTLVTQPALFIIEYALAKQWQQWGIEPAIIIGHSLGEYTAAVLCGTLTRDHALMLLAERARLMQSLAPGAMLTVRLPKSEIIPYLSPQLSIAALNSPALTVVSGPEAAIVGLQNQLSEKKIACRRLPARHAFHSAMLDPILEPYREIVASVPLKAPEIPWISTLSGEPMTASQATEPDYWVQQMRQPVQFAAGLERVLADGPGCLLEVGPGKALATFAKQHPSRKARHEIFISLPDAGAITGALTTILGSLGRLWLAGASVDWRGLHDHKQRRHVSLPAYPFERIRYWADPATALSASAKSSGETADTTRAENVIDSPLVTPNRDNSQNSIMENSGTCANSVSHRDRVLADLRMLFSELSGMSSDALGNATPFVEIGLDSLVLTQASAAIQKKFAVKIRFRELLEDLSTLDALTEYLVPLVAPAPPDVTHVRDEMPDTQTSARQKLNGAIHGEREILNAAAPRLEITANVEAAGLERIVKQQLDLMQQQLDLLRGGPLVLSVTAQATPVAANGGMEVPQFGHYSSAANASVKQPATQEKSVAGQDSTSNRGFGPYKPVHKGRVGGMTASQQRHVEQLTRRYTTKTQRSKSYAAEHRKHLADPRMVSGFRLLWKELIYPIVTERSAGSRLWDIDGNEYIDLTSGFGSIFFGHAPPFVTAALHQQLQQGMEIGPQSPLAGKVAGLICELTGMERAAFCNTGSEAVLAAMRIARTVTGRDKIATFSGDYHGIFDEVIVRSANRNGQLRSIPAAPGIPASATENIILLDHDDPHCLENLRSHAHELAAIIIEPVQGRRLDHQPKEFFHQVRKLTAEAGVALIFDEIITGFRTHLGGMQAVYGIKADIATYGKVIGGGFPIGIVTGKAEYMDALDGGAWNYGDSSAPEVGMTYFAGTFVRHPLALAAAWACLNYLKEQGPALQDGVNQRTERLVKALRDAAENAHVPLRIPHYSSIFSVEFPPDWPYANLLYVYMRDKGIHVWEGRSWILTTAHSDEDVQRIVEAFTESLGEMQAAGFLASPPNPSEPDRKSHDRQSPIPSECPITDAQRELWLAAQMGDEASRAFIDTVILQLRGAFDADAMIRAVNDLVARHDALRSRFSENGETVEVAAALTIDVPFNDISTLEPSARDQQSSEIAARENHQLFNLQQGPLLRCRIVKRATDDHLLLLTSHHIVVDGWSHGVLLNELGILYSVHCGADVERPACAAQFSDYARWQQDQQHSSERQENENYWLAQFESPSPILELPADRPRPATRTYSGGLQSLALPLSLSSALRRVATENGTMLFATLLASFNVLMHRLSGQDDLVVAISAAGQLSFAAPDLVGHCVNFLPLRSPVRSAMAFSEHLLSVRTLVLDAFEHQDYTYGSLLQKLKLPRDSSQAPLVSVSFNLDKVELKPCFHGLDVELTAQPRTGVNFDSEVNVVDTGNQITVQWQYNRDLFDAGTIERWLMHYQTLLEGIVTNPEGAIGELPLLTPAEARQLIVEWNDTKKDYGSGQAVHELFEAQVERTPNAVAVIFENQQLSYQELNARSNQVAHRLKKQGVGPNVLVGIYLERSLEMIMGLLAILKAGGAYLPLDPTYPEERLEFMLADSGAPFLLTEQSLIESLANYAGKRLCINGATDANASESEENPRGGAQCEDLAYVIYTSGSTGKPKGVMIEHRSVTNFLESMRREPGMSEHDRLLAVTTLSFDIAGLEIYLPLTVGARVILASRAVVTDAGRLAEYVRDSGATVMQATPVTWGMILAVGWQGSQELKVLCGGEALTIDLANQLKSKVASLWNLYGPTETTIWSAVCRVSAGTTPISLGRPIANTQIHILDGQLNPVPVGVVGEVHIGGTGLARGYLNRPELTAARFINHSFDGEPERRLYKTGDLARYLPDGNIEYLGRIDNQIKIRGFRIELGEIETVLAQHPVIQTAAVIAQEESGGGKRLVAYVVTHRESAVKRSELRDFLKQRLPEYMIPPAFVFLDSLPLTPNGKLDRKALPASDQTKFEQEANFVPPRSPVEQLLTEIWAGVLRVETIGIHDNFFDLGGHSLLAMQAISSMRGMLQVELPLRSLFENPTVARLADSIAKMHHKEHGGRQIPLYSVSRQKDIPLSFAQQRLWFLDKLEPGSGAYNIPEAIRIRGQLDVTALELSVNEIIRRHEILRTTFRMAEEEAVQIVAPSRSVSLPIWDLTEHSESEREDKAQSLAKEEAHRPFDLAGGPLVRSRLLRLGIEDHVFLLTVHHIVADGWSIGVLYRELSVLYEAFTKSEANPLTDLQIQYADYAVWQRQWLQDAVLYTQLDYWKARLYDIPLLELPTDRPRPAVQSHRGAIRYFKLTQELTQRIKALSRKHDVTLYMTLLAAFQTLLYRYTGQEDVAVGSPIAGRNRTEFEQLIGLFVNTLVLRSDLSGNPTFAVLLARVREVALGAYANQDVPFEKLVQEVNPERHLSHSPLFQVMFVVQNLPMAPLQLAGLEVLPLEIDCDITKFDLTLAMVEESNSLSGSFQYNSDLFNADTIERWLTHYQTLLEGLVAHPETTIAELPMLTSAQTHQQLIEWNDTEKDYPLDKCIHELFEAQVKRTPDAVAVVFEGEQLTYCELNARANQLAYQLRKMGVGPELPVGLCLERSLEMVIGLFAILKAGGAYVPLDPTYPVERLQFMLQDSGASLLVTQKTLVNLVPQYAGNRVCIDADNAPMLESRENLPAMATSNNLAYLIYTSGSTGTPKGVTIEHRSVVNFLAAMRLEPGINEHDRLLAVTTLSFDIAGLEICLPLATGACVILASRALATDPGRLAAYITECSATVMQATPVTWHMLIAAGWQGSPRLKILCGGEALTLGLANQLSTKVASLWNMYGPTETTIWSAAIRVSTKATMISLGRPIANTQVFILDSQLRPVPIGVAGELHIGGAGLARGYHNRPELSSEKFIRNPFSADPNARLYKTGDLARYLPDGNLEHLGRIDFQVKIRGFRIELGEIQSMLSKHAAVQEVVVIVREDIPEDKRLVAYVVVNQTCAVEIAELRDFLKQRLPDHMIPSAWVILPCLPLTANGKLDRKSLPKPEQSREDLATAYAEPRNPVEKKIAAIWCETLGIKRVGVHDNFFDLGGHSLLALRVVEQIRQEYQTEFPLHLLFQYPTVATQAERIDSKTEAPVTKSKVPVKVSSALFEFQPGSKGQPVFFVPGGEGGDFEFLVYARMAHFVGSDYAFYGLKARSADGTTAAQPTVDAMSEDYIKEIRAIQPEGPYFLIGNCIGGVVAYEMARQLRARGEEVGALILMDAEPPTPIGRLLCRIERLDKDLRGWWNVNYYVIRAGHHFDRLRQLSAYEWPRYLIQGTLSGVSGLVQHPARTASATGLVHSAGTLDSTANNKIRRSYEDTLRSYPTRPYEGRVTMLTNETSYRSDPHLGWSAFIRGEIEVHKVIGDHEQYIRKHVEETARVLRTCLDKAQSRRAMTLPTNFSVEDDVQQVKTKTSENWVAPPSPPKKLENTHRDQIEDRLSG